MARTPVLPMLFSRYSSSANFARVRSPTGVSKLPLALKIVQKATYLGLGKFARVYLLYEQRVCVEIQFQPFVQVAGALPEDEIKHGR